MEGSKGRILGCRGDSVRANREEGETGTLCGLGELTPLAKVGFSCRNLVDSGTFQKSWEKRSGLSFHSLFHFKGDVFN